MNFDSIPQQENHQLNGNYTANPLLEGALNWARRGFPVFPVYWPREDGTCACNRACDSPCKHPIGDVAPHGCKDATRDENIIRYWWRLYPQANIGLAMGYGFVAADLDVKKGANGLETFLNLNLFFDTLTNRTPSGGFHAIYATPDDFQNQVHHRLLPGIDIRSLNGYVLAPPSRTAEGHYSVELDRTPEPLPLVLKALMRPPQGPQSNAVLADTDGQASIQRVIEIAKTYPPGIQGQGGNNQLYALAALACRDYALSPETAIDILWEHFNPRCLPPEPNFARFQATVHNAAGYGVNAIGEKSPERFVESVQVPETAPACPQGGQGGSGMGEGAPAAAQAPMASLPPFQQPLVTPLLPVEEFNFDLLPRPLRGWAQDIQERLQCPPDFIGPSALVVLGSILGARIVVRPLQNDRSWNEAANNYGMTVADPGAKKSPAQSAVLSPLKRIEKAAREQYERALQRFEVGKKLKEAANTSIEKAAIDRTKQSAKVKEITLHDIENEIDAIIDGTKSIEGDAPRDKCYIANDINSASLSELLRDNPDGILISRDELMALLQLSENENAGDMRQLFLEGWQGLSSHLVHRIKRGRVYIPNLCISVLGGIQPGVIAPYIHAAQSGGKGADGFLERFQFAVWPDKPKELYKVNDKPRNFELEKQAFAAFEGLAKLTPEDCEAQTDKDAEGNPYGHPYLNFTLEAQGVFNNWLEATENHRRRDENSEPIDGHLSKYPKLVASMALLYHLVEKGRGPIPLAALQKALWLAAYLETHARRIYDSGSLAVYNAAKLVIKKAKRGQLPATGFTARDVYRKGWGQAADKELVQDALDLLMEHGWIMSQEVQNPKGGPSTSKYVLRTH